MSIQVGPWEKSGKSPIDVLRSKTNRKIVQEQKNYPIRPNDFRGVPIWLMMQFEFFSSMLWALMISTMFVAGDPTWVLYSTAYVAAAYQTVGRETDTEGTALLVRWLARPEDLLSVQMVLVKLVGQVIGAFIGGAIFIAVTGTPNPMALVVEPGKAFFFLAFLQAAVIPFRAKIPTYTDANGHLFAAIMIVAVTYPLQARMPGVTGRISSDIGRILANMVFKNAESKENGVDILWICIAGPLVGLIIGLCVIKYFRMMEKKYSHTWDESKALPRISMMGLTGRPSVLEMSQAQLKDMDSATSAAQDEYNTHDDPAPVAVEAPQSPNAFNA